MVALRDIARRNLVEAQASKFIDQDGVAYGIDHLVNRQKVASMPWFYLIAHGEVPGYQSRHVLGYNGSVGTALEDVTEIGDVITKVPGGATDTAIALEVLSTSVNDDSAGTGARTVEVHGLDANWKEQSEIITMDGTSVVALSGTWTRVNNVHVMTAGSGGLAAGNITVENLGNSETYGQVTAGGNMSLEAFFTVPAILADDTVITKALIVSWQGGGTSKETRLILQATTDWDDRTLIPGIFHFQDIVVVKDATTHREFLLPLNIAAKSDIKVSAQAIAGGAGGLAAASFELFYE